MLLICLLLINTEPVLLYRGKDYSGNILPNIAYPTKGKYNLNATCAWKPTNESYMCNWLITGSEYSMETKSGTS